ncbi:MULTISPECIES: CtrA inhibitor SciP [unclassified Paracoccus (in: a-proteobacteria)]|uniref:CtrA inhibitor SciP n=1 Tax=unclassified Paracoccus (in: a-proteobacteria) TaxID=2688777 RepID=UPI0012B3ACBD|nr:MULTISPECIES: DUF1153 domain-containing protein [unclassified Paracoccus (in: a-proteobacteria)]UXU74625.1 DUF1153 domain-containing protein [Paracoccus sp. SMMA_5]UXU80519.1 DUF1153 domain-containing protein [Paracoccus sp. SMMA_5_TC]
MFLKKTTGPRTAILPDGRILTLADLPDPQTRWVASRKAVVVDAVRYGLLPRSEAIARYGLTEEEFDSWDAALSRYGANALKVTQMQKFRQP